MAIWQLLNSEFNVTLTELETTWNFDDIIRATTILDIKGTIDELLIEREKAKNGRH